MLLVVLLAMSLGRYANAALTRPSALPTVSSVTSSGADLLSRLPKDERGRVIGGTVFPLLNYSPTMITGKSSKWLFPDRGTRRMPFA